MAIDEKKLIEELQRFSNSNEMIEYTTAYDVVQDCIGIVENQPKTDWIPCEERLPSENGWYLVTNSLGVVQQQYWGANHWNKLRDECVIAWTNLPQPYKREGAE